MSSIAAVAAPGATRLKVHWTDRIGNLLLVAGGLALAVFLLAPMITILAKSVENKAGDFVALATFTEYF